MQKYEVLKEDIAELENEVKNLDDIISKEVIEDEYAVLARENLSGMVDMKKKELAELEEELERKPVDGVFRFENEGVVSSLMFAHVIDVVENLKYTTTETAEKSLKSLGVCKIDETKRVSEKVGKIQEDIDELVQDVEHLEDAIRKHIAGEGEEGKEFDEYVISARDHLIGMVDMKKKELNNIVHNYIREVTVLNNIKEIISGIDFSKGRVDKIKHMIEVSNNILDVYSKNMLPESCKCQHGHSGCDMMYHF